MTLLVEAQHEENTTRHGRKPSGSSMGLSFHRYCPGDAWTPAMNLYQDEVFYYVVMDLAGVKSKEIDVRVDERGGLVITGSRDLPDVPAPHGAVKLHLMEIDHGRFCRSLDLPPDADVDRVEASYRGGYLWVSVAKKSLKVKKNGIGTQKR